MPGQWMHGCFVHCRRSWETISVPLTETNNPRVTLPVSLTACKGARVGGVRHCALPPCCQWQEVNSTTTREKPICIYRLPTHQHYVIVMGNSILRRWKFRIGSVCGIIGIFHPLSQCTKISGTCGKIRKSERDTVYLSFCRTPLLQFPAIQH